MTHTAEQPPKFLLSYHYFKKQDLDALVDRMPIKPMIFADCGAYSAFSQGVTIDIKDYGAWIKRWSHLITTYVNLDVIRDPKATGQNQLILERMGLEPIPVFHTGTDFKHLDRLMKRYPYIALGGMVGAERQATLRWAATCHKRAQDFGCVFHGFGQTSMDNIMSIPWYSVDSSSWAGGFMWGRVDLWDGRRWRQCKIGDRASVMKCAALIRDHGFDPNIFADRSIYHRSFAVKIAAITWHRFEKFLRARHGAIALPGKASGMHIYHAEIGGDKVQEAIEGLHLYHASSSTTEIRQGTEGLHIYLAQATKEDIEREVEALSKIVTKKQDAS